MTVQPARGRRKGEPGSASGAGTGGGASAPSRWRGAPGSRCEALLPSPSGAGGGGSSLPVELLVEEEDQEIDVHFSSVKQFHDRDAFVLQLQQVLFGDTVWRLIGCVGRERNGRTRGDGVRGEQGAPPGPGVTRAEGAAPDTEPPQHHRPASSSRAHAVN